MSEEQTATEAPAEKTYRTIPVEIKNVNIQLDFKVEEGADVHKLRTYQELIEKLKAKFGEDSLLEQLQYLICGTVEKVTISRPTLNDAGSPKNTTTATVPQSSPVSVNIPSQQPSLGDYAIQSTHCPWTGNALKLLDPVSIYNVLCDPQKMSLLTPQDQQMMSAYYNEWYQLEQQRIAEGKKLQQQFSEEIPF